MGCYTERICHGRQAAARRRQLSQLTGSDNPQCVHCCKSDACNSQGCASIGFPIQRGPLCFNCKQSTNPELCRYVKVCEADQVCHLHEEEEFGDKFYVSSCLLQNECQAGVTITDAFGKRTINQKSSMCCSSDLCNIGLSCLAGTFGDKCSLQCGHCSDGGACDFINGTCPNGCSAGWTGVFCKQTCPHGTFGDACSQNCRHCINGSTCDTITGLCSRGCSENWTGMFCNETFAIDCLDILNTGNKRTGIYQIHPWNNSTSKEVVCDMDTMGGGWTVFQKRIDGSVSFSRNWTEYQHGFGNTSTEYWLGNDAIHELTRNSSSLYVKIQNTNGHHYFRYYSDFRISGADDDFKLHLGSYSNGTARESLIASNNDKTFKTPDHASSISMACFGYTRGGWWFGCCHSAYLNGVYGSSKWVNPWSSEIRSGTNFRSSQMMTRRHK
ncbi:multiple epidermal growth factor-like domains protein 11 [Saccostrea echinata]|uniref:multiple epidermal growth factor-like domains protein 11 n=1 Tax=Saccostrea echinata TaxID=191078 RepID=UPI002A815E9A|nr:multiple epidermal growth factor-like domains protein 11 [Saccostrea echinata]